MGELEIECNTEINLLKEYRSTGGCVRRRTMAHEAVDPSHPK